MILLTFMLTECWKQTDDSEPTRSSIYKKVSSIGILTQFLTFKDKYILLISLCFIFSSINLPKVVVIFYLRLRNEFQPFPAKNGL